MKIFQNRLLTTSIFAIALAAATFFSTQSVHAVAKTWQGSPDANLATASNWTDNAAPQTGDTLIFPHGSVVTNNLATDVAIAGISISGTSESYPALEIKGSSVLNIYGTIGGVASNNTIFNVPVNVSDDVTFNTEDGYLVFNYPLSGSGTLTVNGGGMSLSADNSQFSGEMVISGSTSRLSVQGSDNVMGSSSAGTTISNGATLTFSIYNLSVDSLVINEPIIFTAPLNSSSIFTVYACGQGDCSTEATHLKLGGTLTIPSAAKAGIYADTVVMKAIAGGGSLQKAAGSDKQLTINNSSVGQETKEVVISKVDDCPYYIKPGFIYKITVDCSVREFPEQLVVNKQGVLKGTGKLMSTKIEDGGTIAPGNSPGTLSTGNLEFEKGGIYEFEIAGDEAGQYDQINVTGTVKLGDGTLKPVILGEFTPGQGKSYTIINNDGTDAVEGTFFGLAEGATVSVGEKGYFTISYKGGDGNDVVLTTIPGVGDAGEESEGRQSTLIGIGLIAAIGGYFAVKKRHLFIKR